MKKGLNENMKKLMGLIPALIIFAACSSGGELRINDEKLTVLDYSSASFDDDNIGDYPLPPEPARPEPPDFIEIAKAHLSGSHGRIYVGMADLTYPGGYRYIDDSGRIHPASTIKSMIMEYALLQIHAGNASPDEVYDSYTLLYSIEQMIQMSCNESTGTLVARFGRANIQSWLDGNYPGTDLNSDWRNYHHNNKYNETTVEDTVEFLERLWERRNEEPYRQMLDIMFGTIWSREKIPAATEGIANVRVANKTGSYADGDDTADHDMAIVVSYDDDGEILFAYALVFYSFAPYSEITYSAARPAIVAMAEEIYEQVSKFYAENN
ncbi:MAG: class A beta-lactamase-related serine hydrolase [Oscillospiraceae bacterium]|nr:class A beta-lactamase-related serine hydrolase [Oscillospiraceae bacterium]